MRKQFKKAVQAICDAERIVLAGHVNPDGDTLGCVLALTHAFRAMGKEVVPLSADGNQTTALHQVFAAFE